MTDRPYSNQDRLALAGLLTSGAGAGLVGRASNWTLNPDAPVNVRVFGGWHDNAPTVAKPIDSLSNQAHQTRRELQATGLLDASISPSRGGGPFGWGWKRWTPLLSPNPGYDALLQVSHTPQEGLMRFWKAFGMPRYRQATDYGLGSLRQPENYMGEGHNGMRIYDAHTGAHTRFIVPGATPDELTAFSQVSDRPSLGVDNIPVGEHFKKHRFRPKTDPIARATLSMGGGSGAGLLFDDVLKTVDGKKVYDASANNLLDDLLGALRNKHGKNFRLDVLTGGLHTKPEIKAMFDAFQADKSPRFKNVKFHAQVPQEAALGQMSMADAFENSKYLINLPGSTMAEIASMRGHHIPKLINLLPDASKPDMAGHFDTNHKVVERMFPGTRGLPLNAPDRGELLKQFINEGLPEPVYRRRPVLPDYKPVAKAILEDVRANRIAARGKLKLLGLAGLGSAGMLGYGRLHGESPKEKLDRLRDRIAGMISS